MAQQCAKYFVLAFARFEGGSVKVVDGKSIVSRQTMNGGPRLTRGCWARKGDFAIANLLGYFDDFAHNFNVIKLCMVA
jgi:hypothetical protein